MILLLAFDVILDCDCRLTRQSAPGIIMMEIERLEF
jgi:hypothetical protein